MHVYFSSIAAVVRGHDADNMRGPHARKISRRSEDLIVKDPGPDGLAPWPVGHLKINFGGA